MTRQFQTDHQPKSLLDPDDQTILRVLEHDWRKMCGLDVAPAYDAVNPAALDGALPFSFVLQRVSPGVARIRVAGQKLHDMMMMDPRGMPFASFFADDSRETAMAVLEHAFQSPAIVGFALTTPRGFGRKPVRAEALLLPMRDRSGELTRMMGAIVTSGPVPSRPLRFDIAKDVSLRSDVLHAGLVDRRARRGRAPQPSTPAPSPTTAMPKVTPTPRQTPTQTMRPNLRLVVDNTAG